MVLPQTGIILLSSTCDWNRKLVKLHQNSHSQNITHKIGSFQAQIQEGWNHALDGLFQFLALKLQVFKHQIVNFFPRGGPLYPQVHVYYVETSNDDRSPEPSNFLDPCLHLLN